MISLTNAVTIDSRVSGFTYVEVLVATLLIAITLVPALESFTPPITGSDVHTQLAVKEYHLTAKVEDVLADSFPTIEAEALSINDPNIISNLYSDIAGSTNRRLVYLSQYDGDNADNDNDVFTGTDQGLLWIRVNLENTSKEQQRLISSYGSQ